MIHKDLIMKMDLATPTVEMGKVFYHALRAVVELAKAELDKPYDEDKEFFVYEINDGSDDYAYEGGMRDAMKKVIQAIEKELK